MIIGPSETISLSGIWSVSAGDGNIFNMKLPGTLDENNIGHRDTVFPDPNRTKSTDSEDVPNPLDRILGEENPEDAAEFSSPGKGTILTRLTRKYTYEGSVRISRMFSFGDFPGKRIFLEAERCRVLSLLIDGKEVPHFRPETLVTPEIFEVTGLLSGNHMLTLLSDNSYPGLPRDEILCSDLASDESASNWNGILGYLRLRIEETNFIERINVRVRNGKLSAFLEIYAETPCTCVLELASDVLTREYRKKITLPNRYNTFFIEGLECISDAEVWDEEKGILHTFTASLDGVPKTVPFGVRDLSCDENGRLLLNGRRVFLRTETNHGVHPETGYAPMDEEAWKKIFLCYRSYGINAVRFASHCPPEAAFLAADHLGMLLFPELSAADICDPFHTEEALGYYRSELLQLLRCYGNHPSFAFLSLGGGVSYTQEGRKAASELLSLARSVDPGRLYSSGSCITEGTFSFLNDEDFFILSSAALKNRLRETVQELQKSGSKPVFLSGIGGTDILPDYTEIDLFSGNLLPEHLVAMRSLTEERGKKTVWPKMVQGSGERALLFTSLEIQEARKQPELSGVLLAGLQDEPGHGGRFHGMLNAHAQTKLFPFARPERFRMFAGGSVLLADLSQFTFEDGEKMTAEISVVNDGVSELSGDLCVTFLCEERKEERRFPGLFVPAGTTLSVGSVEFSAELPEYGKNGPRSCELLLTLGRIENRYPVYIYENGIPVCPEDVFETEEFGPEARSFLASGGTVFLTPPATEEAMPQSVSLETSGGLLIDRTHPVFAGFPTEDHADLRWSSMMTGRAVLLPGNIRTIISAVDDPGSQRPLGALFEFRYGGGNVLFSSLGLKECCRYPEVRALLGSIYSYLDSYDFSPVQELKPEEFRLLF